MPKYFFSLLALILIPFFIFVSITYANHIPAPQGYVNDLAEVLSEDQENTIETFLKDYEQNTTNEIAVLTIKNLNGDPIEDFAVKVFEEWKIGKDEKDNGILFLASIEDRKMRIEIGYGLEPNLTDSQAGEIIRNIIAPRFKKEDYYGGISDGVQAIQDHLSKNPAEVARGQAKVTFWSVAKALFEIFGDIIIVVILIGIYLPFAYLFAFLGRTKEVWLGAVIGGVIGGGLGWIFGTTFVAMLAGIGGGSAGLLLDYILSRNYQARKAKGLSTSWWGSGGGFFGGKGGFGGFGGGFSGGGGSSGSW